MKLKLFLTLCAVGLQCAFVYSGAKRPLNPTQVFSIGAATNVRGERAEAYGIELCQPLVIHQEKGQCAFNALYNALAVSRLLDGKLDSAYSLFKAEHRQKLFALDRMPWQQFIAQADRRENALAGGYVEIAAYDKLITSIPRTGFGGFVIFDSAQHFMDNMNAGYNGNALDRKPFWDNLKCAFSQSSSYKYCFFLNNTNMAETEQALDSHFICVVVSLDANGKLQCCVMDSENNYQLESLAVLRIAQALATDEFYCPDVDADQACVDASLEHRDAHLKALAEINQLVLHDEAAAQYLAQEELGREKLENERLFQEFLKAEQLSAEMPLPPYVNVSMTRAQLDDEDEDQTYGCFTPTEESKQLTLMAELTSRFEAASDDVLRALIQDNPGVDLAGLIEIMKGKIATSPEEFDRALATSFGKLVPTGINRNQLMTRRHHSNFSQNLKGDVTDPDLD